MAWIVEYGCFYEDYKVNPYRSATYGPYSMAGNRWRDTLTDLADPEGKYTAAIPDSFPIIKPDDLLYTKKTPSFGV